MNTLHNAQVHNLHIGFIVFTAIAMLAVAITVYIELLTKKD